MFHRWGEDPQHSPCGAGEEQMQKEEQTERSAIRAVRRSVWVHADQEIIREARSHSSSPIQENLFIARDLPVFGALRLSSLDAVTVINENV